MCEREREREKGVNPGTPLSLWSSSLTTMVWARGALSVGGVRRKGGGWGGVLHGSKRQELSLRLRLRGLRGSARLDNSFREKCFTETLVPLACNPPVVFLPQFLGPNPPPPPPILPPTHTYVRTFTQPTRSLNLFFSFVV